MPLNVLLPLPLLLPRHPSSVKAPNTTILRESPRDNYSTRALCQSHYGAGYESEELLGDKVHAARIDSEDVTGEHWDKIVERLVPE